jgi:mutator protein MutT
LKIIDVTAAVIEKGERVLIAQRRPDGRHPGRWEFPGGKVEPGETAEDCLAREMVEEMGVAVAVGERLAEVEHSYPDMRIRLIAFSCEITSGRFQDIGCAAHAWVAPKQIGDYDLLPPDRILWGQVLNRGFSTRSK